MIQSEVTRNVVAETRPNLLSLAPQIPQTVSADTNKNIDTNANLMNPTVITNPTPVPLSEITEPKPEVAALPELPQSKPKRKKKFKIIATESPKPEEEDNKTIKITEYMVSKEKSNKVAVTKQHL
jgi:hypothetical protein